MNRSSKHAQIGGGNARLHQKCIQMEMHLRVLSVGSVDRGNIIHDALIEGPGFHLSIATDYWDLRAIPEQDDFQVAVLHNTLDLFELDDACRYIRHRWPHARILVIRADGGCLDDPLYDDRVAPAVAREALLTKIEQMSATPQDRRSQNAHS